MTTIQSIEPAGGMTFRLLPPIEQARIRGWVGKGVVDAAGDPVVVFHGAPARFAEFDRRYQVSPGFFFSSSFSVAERWARYRGTPGCEGRPVVHAVFLRLADPLVIDARGAFWGELQDPYQDPYQAEGRGIDEIARDAHSARHDGLIVHRVQDAPCNLDGGTATTYVAFEPQSIWAALPAIELTPNEADAAA
jgi:hypothetical protein